MHDAQKWREMFCSPVNQLCVTASTRQITAILKHTLRLVPNLDGWPHSSKNILATLVNTFNVHIVIFKTYLFLLHFFVCISKILLSISYTKRGNICNLASLQVLRGNFILRFISRFAFWSLKNDFQDIEAWITDYKLEYKIIFITKP